MPELLNRLLFELSQVTTSKTVKEIELEAALRRLANAADVFRALQDAAIDERCGIVQPVTVADCQELYDAVDDAFDTLKMIGDTP